MLDQYGTWKAALNMVRCGIGNCIVQKNFEKQGICFQIRGDIIYDIPNSTYQTHPGSVSQMAIQDPYLGIEFKATYK